MRPQRVSSRRQLVDGHEWLVELGREPCGQARCALGSDAPDDDGRRRLHRLRQRGRVAHLVVRSVEVERLGLRRRPDPGDDLELLLESVEALTEGWKRDPVGAVLGVVPAGTDAELDPSARHGVDVGDRDRERARETEGGRSDHRAEPDRRRVAGEAGEGGPRVRWARQPAPSRRCASSGRSGRRRRSRAPRRGERPRGAGRSWRLLGVR